MPSLGNFHSLERKIWPQWGDRLGEKFPTDANQLVELCHPGGSTLRTGLCEPNRNSEHEFHQSVSQFSLLREWELWHRKCVCAGVCMPMCVCGESVCMFDEGVWVVSACVFVWWGCVFVCIWWGCVCVCVVRICVCCMGVCVCVCVMRGPGNEMKGSYFLILIRVRK